MPPIPPVAPKETIGVDLGGSKMLVGVVGTDQTVHYRSETSSAGHTQDELLKVLSEELNAARDARPGVAGAGVGLPCTIDRVRGIAISAVNLPIANLPLGEVVGERFGLPVFIDNDANVAALGEHRFGAARGSSNAVMLTIGTGIGGGLILGGELYRGSLGAGAELGHMVVDLDGPPCQGHCPNRGCIEAMASGTALAREGDMAAAANPDSSLGRAVAEGTPITGRLVTEAALAGDGVARGALELIARRLGAALSSLANIFNPDVIVIGGGMARAGELLLGPARDELRARALPPMNETPVVPAGLGADAGMIGAAAMAMTELQAGQAV